jgi:hypothetical protein
MREELKREAALRAEVTARAVAHGKRIVSLWNVTVGKIETEDRTDEGSFKAGDASA